MRNFALTGVAGYIAPRHLRAIKETGNKLIAAMDPHDSVGILDTYFPDASYFNEFERFDRHLEMLRRGPEEMRVNYISICSPNHLHDAHIRLALRIGADAVCEKPLVLNPWNLDALEELEREHHSKINTVLQLRLHPALIELKKTIMAGQRKQKYKVNLTYITSRGLWYQYSWKGVNERSGGIATNIGIHFFDLLIWLFGEVQTNEVYLSESKKMCGYIELVNAHVQWYLSIDKKDLPESILQKGETTLRSIQIDGDEIKFSDGFTDLHTRVYEEILSGNGFGIKEARPSIELVYKIRNASPTKKNGIYRPNIQNILENGQLVQLSR